MNLTEIFHNPAVICTVLIFAAIGLATVTYLAWTILQPCFQYLVSTKTVTAMLWLAILAIGGGTAFGYGTTGPQGAFQHGGMIALVAAVLIGAIFWLRKWVMWVHNEKDTN